jgi:peptidoglycan/LPS O-acetylase OafA/YrhL
VEPWARVPVAGRPRSASGGSGFGYRPGLDGLRCVAVLAVIGYHAAPGALPGGFLGVDVFFVLSGFLITTLLVGEWTRTETIALRAFYLRRALRLFPALAAFLLGLCIYGALFNRAFLSVTLGWLPFVYVTNVMAAFRIGVVAHGHIWSLAAEEQFYLLWPPLLVVMLRSMPRPRVVAATAGLAAVSGLLMVSMWSAGAHWVRLYYGPDTHATPILVGCLLGELWAWGMLPAWRPRLAAVAAAVALLLAVLVLHPSSGALYAGGYTLVAILAAVVLLGVLAVDPAAMRWGPLVTAGRLSYAAYLWHPLLLQMAGRSHLLRGGAVLATFPVAALSMRFVEAPFLRVKDRLGRNGGAALPGGPPGDGLVTGLR